MLRVATMVKAGLGALCLAAAMLAQGAPAVAGVNSGLDLTEPILQAGYSYQNVYYDPGVLDDTRALWLSVPFSFGQFKLTIPYSEDLHLAALKSAARGQGDLTVSYNYVLPLRNPQFRQTLGFTYASPGSGALSSHQQQLAPLYQLSYHLDPHATLLLLAKYGVGYNAAPGWPRYNVLVVSPSALFSLRANGYIALVPAYQRFSGPAYKGTYASSVDVGRVFSGVNVMLNYGLPLGTYSYDHLYRSTYGLSASVQI